MQSSPPFSCGVEGGACLQLKAPKPFADSRRKNLLDGITGSPKLVARGIAHFIKTNTEIDHLVRNMAFTNECECEF